MSSLGTLVLLLVIVSCLAVTTPGGMSDASGMMLLRVGSEQHEPVQGGVR